MTPTTLLLVRHGVTPSTQRAVFCGSGGADPALTEVGRQQAAAAGGWIRSRHTVDAVVASPLRRTRETAAQVAAPLGLEVSLEPGLAEASFGSWDGHTFAEIGERWPDDLQAWLDSTAVAPPGGEAIDVVAARVEAARARLVQQQAGRTVVVVSHVTPIQLLVRAALDAPMSAMFAMELAPGSITSIRYWPDGNASLQSFSVVP